jgi:hypothetical protein
VTTMKAIVAAAVLGMMAGATACGGAPATAKSAASAQPDPGDAQAGDKNACGNHPGSACGAVSPPPPAPK